MLHVLAYPEFAPSVSRALAAFRARHEPERAKLVAPHVTLMFGTRGVEASVISRLAQSAAGTTPYISLTFQAPTIEHDPFEDANKIMLPVSEGREPLISLHRHLYRGAHHIQLDQSRPYNPHMTIATNPDRRALEQIDLGALGSLPIRAEVKKISLVRYGNAALTGVQTFDLAG